MWKNLSYDLFVYRREGIIFNIVMALYMILVAPWVLSAGEGAFYQGKESPWLGILIIAAFVAETYAWPKKLAFVKNAALQRGQIASGGLILSLMYMVVSIIALMVALSSFGIDPTDKNSSIASIATGVVAVAVVLRGIIFLVLLSPDEDLKPSIKYQRPMPIEWFCDAVLGLQACLTFTVTWELIAANTNMNPENPIMYGLNVVVASMIFLFLYLPLRIPYFVEERPLLQEGKHQALFWASLLMILVPAVAVL